MVEGYTEELLFKNYLYKHNYNWTVVNVAGVMFEPYVILCSYLNKKTIVISDNDRFTNDGVNPSSRFINLRELCNKEQIKLVEIDNTLETDLYNHDYLDECIDLLESHNKYSEIFIAKSNKKTEIASKLIESNADLSEWHVISEVISEFKNH